MTEKQKRGFANLSPEQRARIASQGGIAAHKSGKAHQFTSEEAREAGKKGGNASRTRKRTRMIELEAADVLKK